MFVSSKINLKFIMTVLTVFVILPIIFFMYNVDRIILENDLLGRETDKYLYLYEFNGCLTIVFFLVMIFSLFKHKKIWIFYILSFISIILTLISFGASLYIFKNSDQLSKVERYTIIDKFIYKVDKILCNDECPCNIWNTSLFNYDYLEPFFNKSIKNVKNDGALSFKDCSKDIIKRITEDYLDDHVYNLRIVDILNLMSHLEFKFRCSGFYRNEYTIGTEENMIFKYLFSDINRGIPGNYGCAYQMNSIIDEYMNLGITCFLLSLVFQSINLILIIINREIIKTKDINYEKIINPVDVLKIHNNCIPGKFINIGV